MQIGNAKLAFGLSIKLFDDILKGLHGTGAFPSSLTFDQGVEIIDGLDAAIHVDIEIAQPQFSMHVQAGTSERSTRLDLRGTVSPRVVFQDRTSPVLFTIPLSASVIVDIVLKPRTGQAPLIGLAYGGVEVVDAPLRPEFIDDLFATPEVAGVLDSLELDLLTPILDVLETVYFFNAPKPSHDTYPVLLTLMRARSGYAAAIGLLIDIPPSSLGVGDELPSFVPISSEFFAHISPGMTALMVEKGKAELQKWLEDNADGLKVKDLDLTLQNNRVKVQGSVEHTPTDAEGHISGTLQFKHGPGSPTMYLDGADLKLDIDLPWWVTLVGILVPPIGFAVLSAKVLIEHHVPDIAQKEIASMLDDLLANLADALQLEGLSVAGLPIEVYPDRIELKNDAVTAEVQILAYPMTEGLKRADYSRLRQRFVMFHLDSGRRYMAADLADFMSKGLLIVPGYHQVGRSYIRANPDNVEDNNLLERFAF